MATEKVSAFTAHTGLISTQLDSLADGDYSDGGTVLDNGTNLDRFAYAELHVTFGSAPTNKAPIDLYAVLAQDGTNYSDGSSSVRPAAMQYLGTFQVSDTT